MEAIREYLNNLFMSLPETPEVLRAKAELLEMMEDKYEELINEGKTDKEAIGIIISEFGNLEEIAQELGIESYMKKAGEKQGAETTQPSDSADGQTGSANSTAGDGRANADTASASGTSGAKSAGGAEKTRAVYCWSFDDARDYISYAWKHGTFIAVAVFLCICAPFAESVFEACASAGYLPSLLAGGIGTCALFLFVAVAVGLFCAASGMKKGYGKLSRYCVLLDEKAGRYIGQKQERDEQTRLTMRIVGIACCILSVVPSCLNYTANPLLSEIMDLSVLVIAGVGVLLLVLSSSVGNRYAELKKAVGNAGNMKGATFQGAVWQPAPKKGMSAAAIFTLILLALLFLGANFLLVPVFMGTDLDRSVSEVQEYSFDGIREVILDLDMCECSVVRSEGEDDTGSVRVEYNGNERYRPEVKSSGGTLRIQERRSRGRWFTFDIGWFTRPKNREHEVTVYLPQSADAGEFDMQVDVDAGNVTCSGIRVKNLNMVVDAGNANCSDIRMESLDMDVDAGKALVEQCVVTGEATVDVDAGNIDMIKNEIQTLKGDVDMGNITCDLPGSLSGYALELDVDMGDIKVNGERKGGSYKQKAQPLPSGGQSGSIELDADMGDIKIEAELP